MNTIASRQVNHVDNEAKSVRNVASETTASIEKLSPSPPAPAHTLELPNTNPLRSYPQNYDLIYDTEAGSYGWLAPTQGESLSLTCHWLSPPLAGECTDVDQHTLDRRSASGALKIVCESVPHPHDCWWIPLILNRSPTEFGITARESSPAHHSGSLFPKSIRRSGLIDETELYLDEPTRPYKSPAVSTRDLKCVRLRSRAKVSDFLESPLVDHRLGDVQGWKAVFAAVSPEGHIVALTTLGRPPSRKIDPNAGGKHPKYGEVTNLTRYAAHPNRPENVATWLIARARRWAALSGYETLLTYAGVDDNRGTIYRAAGFREEQSSEVDGSTWTNRSGREERHEYELKPFLARLTDCSPLNELEDTQFGSSYDSRQTDGETVEQTTLSGKSFQPSPDSGASPNGVLRLNRPTEGVGEMTEEILETTAARESQFTAKELKSHLNQADACYGYAADGDIIALACVVQPPIDRYTSAGERAICRSESEQSASPRRDTKARVTALAVAPSACVHLSTKVGELLGHIRQWSKLEGFDGIVVDVSPPVDCPDFTGTNIQRAPSEVVYSACKDTNVPATPLL